MTGYRIGGDREAWGKGRTHCVHWPGHWVGECE